MPRRQQSGRRDPGRAGRRDKDPAASMALLREVMDPPLDPGYASSADRRERAGLPRSTGGRTLLLVVTSIVLGFLLSVAAQTLRTPDSADATTKAELADRIQDAAELGDERAAEITVLRSEVAQLQDRRADPAADQREREAAALHAGATSVIGPGVLLTLNDPPPTADRRDDERVLARDLQTIVNGLWAHGAEAIAINDQRLTSTSTIRFAGLAIVVDLKALARPYEVAVIGDQAQLLEELGPGGTGTYLGELRSDYSIVVDLEARDEVRLPAATRPSTRVAHVIEDQPTQEDDS